MDNIMNVPLQEWISANSPDKKMLWKNSWSNQVCFVRDEIPRFLSDTYDSYITVKENITVISTHTSKSIELPVYCIKANGDKIILRNNFHDWKVSVETHNLHKIDFQKLGIVKNTSAQVHQVYCEGFKPEWVYKPYDDDRFKYTVEIYNDFDLKLFFWTIQKAKLIKEGIFKEK
jgi:hypothetical protein